MKRRPLFAGNWKMYKSAPEAQDFLAKFLKLFQEKRANSAAEYTVLAQAALLSSLQNYWQQEGASIAQKAKIDFSWGPQNIYWQAEGAFTGELSPKLARDFGSKYAVVGHSERRQFFGESNLSAAKRAKAAHDFGLQAIFCVGENLEQREKAQIFTTLDAQCGALVAELSAMPPGFVLAYEPVWAIGTGKTATAAQAEEVHAYLREYFGKTWSKSAAAELRILYGGSVKPQNSKELLACANIDGVLVGGASLDPQSFFEIAANAN